MGNKEFFINKAKLNYILIDQTLANQFTEECGWSSETPSTFYLNLKYSDETYLPISIFQNELTPLQSIIKYLKENLRLTNRKISLLLDKDIKTIWATYKAIEKEKTTPPRADGGAALQIPVSIFKDTPLSTLEALVQFLRKLDLNFAEISRLLKKDQRTIWTVNVRAQKKLGKKNEQK